MAAAALHSVLMDAALTGDINRLYDELQRNPNVLQQLDEIPFIDTVLHVAASRGQSRFATEVTRLRPSLTRKLNHEGFSPLHLAVLHGQDKTALQLVKENFDLIRLKGRQGFTPLHCAARTGNIHLLGEFLSTSPTSLEDVTVGEETAMVIALKNDMIEAFEFLVVWIVLGYDEIPNWKRKIISYQDDEGLTVHERYLSKTGRKDEIVTLLEGILQNQIQHFVAPSLFIIIDPHISLLRPEQKLKLAAYKGNIDLLYSAISEDPDLLERIDKVPFINTPLHIAAAMGKKLFALEIMTLKPSFARKLNQDGCSPLHLAVDNEQFDTMLRLVDIDNDLVKTKGKHGKTVLHRTVEKGDADHIARLLLACPESVLDVTNRKETVLHIAMEHGRVDALEVINGFLFQVGGTQIRSWTNDEGKTIWQIARTRDNQEINRWVSNQQMGIKWLLRPGRILIFGTPKRVDIGNTESVATSIHEGTSPSGFLRGEISNSEALAFYMRNFKLRFLPEDRDVILVVATLIAATTYQAVLSPPGGVWQGDPTLLYPSSDDNSRSTTNSGVYDRTKNAGPLGFVGKTVLAAFVWSSFMVANSLAFFWSVSMICVLLPSGTETVYALVALLMICYWLSLHITGYGSYGWMIFLAVCAIYIMLPRARQPLRISQLNKAAYRLNEHRRRRFA